LLRIAVAEAWEQIGNSEEGERLLLDAIAKEMVKTQQTSEI
jgi:hypothetical protein